MGESIQMLCTAEAAKYLGIKPHTFRSFRCKDRKNDNAKLLQSLKQQTKNGTNYYRVSDLEKIKAKLNVKPVVNRLNHKRINACPAPGCGKPNGNAVFCSSACRYAYHNAKRTPEQIKQMNKKASLNSQRAVRPTRSLDVSISIGPKFEMGKQITSAPLCACGRGSANPFPGPFTGKCSTCVIEASYKMTQHGKRMRGI